MDTAIGQYYQRPAIEIYTKYSWKYVGTVYATLTVSAVLSTYYIFLMGYCNIYIYMALFDNIEWDKSNSDKLLLDVKNYFRNHILELDKMKVV